VAFSASKKEVAAGRTGFYLDAHCSATKSTARPDLGASRGCRATQADYPITRLKLTTLMVALACLVSLGVTCCLESSLWGHSDLSVDAKRVGWRSQSKPLIERDTWYVSYRAKIASAGDHPRGTRRFKSEADARQFAHQIIKDGWSAIAGTINPHKPKRIISSRQILYWIAELE